MSSHRSPSRPVLPSAPPVGRSSSPRTPVSARAWTALTLLARAALASGLVTMALGGVVRATGSGLACPDWPLCHGRLIPPPALGPWIEYIHRLSVVSTTLLTALLTGSVLWGRAWRVDRLLALALLAPLLLLGLVGLGAVIVLLELPPLWALAHMATAATFIGVLAVVAARTGPRAPAPMGGAALSTALLLVPFVLLLVISGAWVTRWGASAVCPSLPLCGSPADGSLWLRGIHMFHRWTALAVVGLMGWTVWEVWRGGGATRWLAGVTTLLLAAQVGLGVANVVLGLPTWGRAAHVAGTGLLVASVMYLVGSLRPSPPPVVAVEGAPGRPLLRTVMACLSLTKPRILALLLLTTLGAMVAAGRGSVPWGLALATLGAGALCAGGAGAVNNYLDRDIDERMRRTRRRPLPAGLLSPRSALFFGLGVSLASVPLFWFFVGPVPALLAVAAWFYYVVFYTLYLKRRTPQNIVIGGAAGAFPPLIGWTAVEGSITLEGLLLFLIIFLWTPPHAWALALLAREDYQRAGIPMLPVVQGERATARQVLLYTVLFLGAILLPAALGRFGGFYLGSALLLGALLLALAVLVWRRPGRTPALLLYRASTLSLALLFVALIVDRSLLA